MRERIDITEIEADTKIRAKYLRALENEEWDLLPGPTTSRASCARTRDALGPRRAAAGRGVQAAPRAPERRRAAADRAAARRRERAARAPRRGPIIPRWVVRARRDRRACSSRCTRSGNSGGGDERPTRRRPRPRTTTQPRRRPRPRPRRRRLEPLAQAQGPAGARVTVVATGPVYVCLKAARRAHADQRRDPAAGAARSGPTARQRLRAAAGQRQRAPGDQRQAADASPPVGQRDRLRHHRDPACGRCRAPAGRSAGAMSARAGIVVTGTEVLTGRVADRNGPWLSERLRELGVELAHTLVVGDRPQDMRARAALPGRGGHGPDRHQRRAGPDRRRPDGGGRRGASRAAPMVLDEALEAADRGDPRAAASRAGPTSTTRRSRAANRKQAMVPAGATVLEPVGTAPGLVVPPASGHAARRSSCCPGRRASCSRCGRPRSRPTRFAPAIAGARRATARRCCGCSGSRSRRSPRRCGVARRRGHRARALEITTCLRRGEIEIVTRFEPPRPRAPTTPSRRSCASATPTRCSPTTARRSTSRSRRCCASAA